MEIFNFSLEINEKKMNHLLKFKRDYACFPEGMIICGDPIDFKIVASDRIIGVAHERIHTPRVITPALKERSEKPSDIIESALRCMLFDMEGVDLDIDIAWKDKPDLSFKNTEELAREIFSIVLRNLPEIGEKRKLTNELRSIIVLPDQIESITMRRTEYKPASEKEENQNTGLYKVKASRIQVSINRKYDVCVKYMQECTESWLLLVYDTGRRSYSASIDGETAALPYDSPFTKTIYYDLPCRKVFVLNGS